MIQIARRVQEQFTGFVDRQHQHPTGVVGRAIGERMVRQHAPETDWTIAQLEISPADRVLELGFGAGRGVALAAKQAYRGRVVGIDLSTTMVQAARRRNRAAIEAGRVTLLKGDVEALPFASEQFDKIFSIHTFYFWTEPLGIIEEISRILRPGGIIHSDALMSLPKSILTNYVSTLPATKLQALNRALLVGLDLDADL